MTEAQARVAFFKLTNILYHLDIIERNDVFDAQIKFMSSEAVKINLIIPTVDSDE